MSVQILIQGKLLGLDDFLTAAPISSDEVVVARSLWISLVCEVVPRALLAELELARVLLGSSGGGQFLLVLTDAVRERAEQFLRQSAAQIKAATGGHVRLVWAVTENLGDWTVVRKRLQDAMRARESAPLAQERSFAPFQPAAAEHTIFTPEFAQALRTTSAIGWSPDLPGVITTGPAKRAWPVSANLSLDGITLSRQYAHSELAKTEGEPATTAELASRATGQPAWGVLRGDVDLFGLRLRRLQSIEEHVQLSMLYKHFFAGELEVLSMGGEFFRRVNILYSGGDDFAVYGAWDALVLFAGEMQRTFHRFAEENLKEFPGAEAKTVTMAMAIAGEGQNLGQVYAQAGRDLAVAKAADKDCIYLFGRVVEWKQLADAADLKDAVTRVSEEFKAAGRQFVNELTRIYAKAQSVTESPADHERLLRRAYRFQRRYNRAAYSRREKEFQKLRTHLIGEIVGRNIRPAAGKQLRLRPAGVVAIEWARLSKEV
jgi:CRISPR-associated protein Csm1